MGVQHKSAFIIMVLIFSSTQSEGYDGTVARGEVQSCSGCSLRNLPDVKRFIFDDLPKYNGVEFHQISGAVPELVLFDNSDKELERIALSQLSRKECNKLVSKWFQLKQDQSSREESREDL